MKSIYFTLLVLWSVLYVEKAFTETKEKVIYEYKEYESFDLGNLEIKGKIIAPGDLSVKERKRKEFSRDIYLRKNYDQEIAEDIIELR
jgi:hypothetical protein